MKLIGKIIATALCLAVYNANADDIMVESISIPQGGQTTICIKMNNSDNIYTAGQMVLKLPMGVTAVLDSNENPITKKGERISTTDHSIGSTHLEDGKDQFTIFSISSDAIAGTDGTLFYITIEADESLKAGTELEGVLSNIEMTTTNATPVIFNDQVFTLSIGEKADTRILLDENATTIPKNATGIDVRVKFDLRADLWSSLCLPFAMNETQVKRAFGEDVILADFTSWSSEEDNDGNTVAITIGFTEVTNIEANHPYIIKLSTDIKEFTVDGVDIKIEGEPSVQVGKKKAERGYFVGTYMASEYIPENDLFLDGNKFLYSLGQTKMKAFHAYFELADVLKNTSASDTMVSMTLERETTEIHQVNAGFIGIGTIYNLAGQRVQNSERGLNIIKMSDGTTRKVVK
ncbi:MAG: hypothetical protein IJV10_01625 [Prevotella sp.]|nr:hypothetical protein [Prevotella sp.]